MALADLSQAIPFLLFLTLFVLLGVYPAWQRTAALIRKFLAASNKAVISPDDSYLDQPNDFIAEQLPALQLDTVETIVFQRLILNDGKNPSRKQLNADLHLEPALLKTTLDSLRHKGLLQITMTALPIIRFRLTEKGRKYAEQSGAASPFR